MPTEINDNDKSANFEGINNSSPTEELSTGALEQRNTAQCEDINNLEQGSDDAIQSRELGNNQEIANRSDGDNCENAEISLDSNKKKKVHVRRCIAGCEDFKVLHRVPARTEEANLWFNLLGRPDLLNARPSGHRVCNLHFSSKMRGTSGVRLHYWALPDANLPANSVPPPVVKPVIQISPSKLQSLEGKKVIQANFPGNATERLIHTPRGPLQTTQVVKSPLTTAQMLLQPVMKTNVQPIHTASIPRNMSTTQTFQIQPNQLMGMQIQLPNVIAPPAQQHQQQVLNGQLVNFNRTSAPNPILLPRISAQGNHLPGTQFSVVNPYIIRPTQHVSHANNVQVPSTQVNTLSTITGKILPQIINELTFANPMNAGALLQSFQNELVKQLMVSESQNMKLSGENIIEIPQHLVVKLVFTKRGEQLPEDYKSKPQNKDLDENCKCRHCCRQRSDNGDSILKQILEVPIKPKPQIGHKSIQCRLERYTKPKEEKKEEKKPEPKVIKVDKCTSTADEVEEEFERLMEVDVPEVKGFRYIEDGKCVCLTCGKQFETSSYAKIHIQMHKEKSRLCCRCGKMFANSVKCYTHERMCSLDVDREEERRNGKPSYSTTPAERVCEYCGRYSNSLIKHLDHLNSHTGARPHKCSCGAEFRNLPNFYTHRKRFGCKNAPAEVPYGRRMRIRKTNDGTEVKTEKKEKKRGSGFRDRWSASNPDRYLCTVCGVRSKDYTAFRSHRKKHITERKYVCQVCNNSYKEPIALRSHIKNVHLDKSRCKHCGKICTPYYMPIHMRTHTGERPFVCILCDQKFISKIALRLHKINVHNVGTPIPTNKSSYKCCMCDRAFGSKRAMENHLAKMAHLEKEYRWKEKVGLTFFTCIYCNSSFEDFGKYGSHMGSVHNSHIFRKMEQTLKEFEQAPPQDFPLNGVNESEIIEENFSEMIEEYIDEMEVMKTEPEDVPNNIETQRAVESLEEEIIVKDEQVEDEMCIIRSEDQIVESEEIVSIGEHMIEFLDFHEVKDLQIEFLDQDNMECDDLQK